MEDGGEFSREAVMSPEVGTVRKALVVDFDERVGFGNEVGEVGADGSGIGTFEEDFVPSRHSQFCGAAQDPLALIAVDVRFFNIFFA